MMVLKEIGTYNSAWMTAVWNAHLEARRRNHRMVVRMIPAYNDSLIKSWYPRVWPSVRHYATTS
jgi:hypothetical protein